MHAWNNLSDVKWKWKSFEDLEVVSAFWEYECVGCKLFYGMWAGYLWNFQKQSPAVFKNLL